MIVAVASDKGRPGVTTLAVLLALVWPGERVVLEADPSGGDLAFRLHHAATGGFLEAEPTVLTLAADARAGLPEGAFPRYTQPTTLGVPVIAGALSAEAYTAMSRMWDAVAREASQWSGTVFADLGRLQPGHAAAVVARAAAALVLVTGADVESLYRLRERIGGMTRLVGTAGTTRSAVSIVVRAPAREQKTAVTQVRHLLESVGSPAQVVGALADDPPGAAGLYGGQLTRRVSGSELVRSATGIAETLLASYPDLVQATLPVPVNQRPMTTAPVGGTP